MNPSAYDMLCLHYKKIHNLSHFSSFGYWDQATQMPPGAGVSRNQALSELASLIHQLHTDTKISQWLDTLQQDSALTLKNPLLTSSIREIERSYEAHTILPESLVKAMTEAKMTCGQAWRSQKKNNDWDGFAKNLKEVVSLSRQEASIRSDSGFSTPYDALLDQYEPGMTSQQLDVLFGDVKTWLPGLIQEVLNVQASQKTVPLPGPFPITRQHQLSKNIMALLGFDFNHGRLDVSAHPFCGGVPDDVRITTRYDEHDAISSIMAVVHETGHALYEQGLPHEWCHLPVGKARSIGIHESQSLFFEMQIGRSKAFLSLITPLLSETLNIDRQHESLHLINLHDLYQKVKPSYIRIDADEVTYPAHIMLRYEIEKDLINGDIEVEHIPEKWDELLDHYLGVTCKGQHSIGCMQDIHWSEGLFGYFPCYTLGAMYAAQLFSAIRTQYQGALEVDIANGDFSKIKAWLSENIWSKASVLETHNLMKEATGQPLDAIYFKRHLEKRYLDLHTGI